ncbi:MAG: hypothetical protein ACI9FD_003900 [Gammaproteobacteria bacterium]|jgi:hypothetical protein
MLASDSIRKTYGARLNQININPYALHPQHSIPSSFLATNAPIALTVIRGRRWYRGHVQVALRKTGR